jgi:hypothetical protein
MHDTNRDADLILANKASHLRSLCSKATGIPADKTDCPVAPIAAATSSSSGYSPRYHLVRHYPALRAIFFSEF